MAGARFIDNLSRDGIVGDMLCSYIYEGAGFITSVVVVVVVVAGAGGGRCGWWQVRVVAGAGGGRCGWWQVRVVRDFTHYGSSSLEGLPDH